MAARALPDSLHAALTEASDPQKRVTIVYADRAHLSAESRRAIEPLIRLLGDVEDADHLFGYFYHGESTSGCVAGAGRAP